MNKINYIKSEDELKEIMGRYGFQTTELECEYRVSFGGREAVLSHDELNKFCREIGPYYTPIISRIYNQFSNKKIVNWIFCDDRLPNKEDGSVLILVAELNHGENPEDDNAHWNVDTDEGTFDGEYWSTVNDWDEGQPWRVIAWAKKDIPSLDVIKKHWGKDASNT